MFEVMYNVLPFGFSLSLLSLTASLFVWAIWRRYMPRVMYGSLGLLALVIYVLWLANFLSTVFCFSPGPGCGGRVFIPMASAVATAYILLVYSALAVVVAITRRFLGRQTKKLTLAILIVVMASVLILVTDSLLPFKYSSARAFDNYNLNIPAIPTGFE